MNEIPWAVVGPLLAVVVAVDVVALVDLSRRDVKMGPRWLWALLIVLSFPFGVILYVVLARQHPDEVRVEDTRPDAYRQAPPPSPDERSGDRGARIALPAGAAPTASAASGPTPLVRTRGLRKVYGDVAAVDGVDLAVPRGATYGLIGPNGAGKTTLLSLLTGLRSPTEGDIAIDVPRERIAVLPDTPEFEPWLTAAEVVDLARNLQAPATDPDHVDMALGETGLLGVRDRRVGGFSRGMLQRLGLAACLVTRPDLYFLDEPSSALDPAGRREVLDLIGHLAGDATVVLSTHILSDVQQVCDTVGVIDRGRLRYQGPLPDLLSRTSSAFLVSVRPPADAVVTALRASELVETVDERAPGQLRVQVADAARAETELPRLLADAGAHLVAFNPATDLESAFLKLTA